MKRGLVLAVRESIDKKTNENQVWVTIGKLPNKHKESGKIFFPMKQETILLTCAVKERDINKFDAYKSLKIGSIVNIRMAINEVSDTTYVDFLEPVVLSPFSEKDIFGE